MSRDGCLSMKPNTRQSETKIEMLKGKRSALRAPKSQDINYGDNADKPYVVPETNDCQKTFLNYLEKRRTNSNSSKGFLKNIPCKHNRLID